MRIPNLKGVLFRTLHATSLHAMQMKTVDTSCRVPTGCVMTGRNALRPYCHADEARKESVEICVNLW